MSVADVPPDAVATPEPEVTPVPTVTPTIDAIEIDGARNFFAGAGEEGANVRLFVDDVLVGESVVGGGRFRNDDAERLTVRAVGPQGSRDLVPLRRLNGKGQQQERQPECLLHHFFSLSTNAMERG
jgi:hypothetical protein